MSSPKTATFEQKLSESWSAVCHWFGASWSLTQWWLGRACWLIPIMTLFVFVSIFGHRYYAQLATFETAQLVTAQTQQRLDLRARAELARQTLVSPTITSKASLEKLELPREDTLQLTPLHRFFQEQAMRGVELKQVDYQWDKDQGLQSKQRAVRKVDVIISLNASYPALREWLGKLLLQTPNAQLTNLQIQRISKDTAMTNCLVTVSVYFQGLL